MHKRDLVAALLPVPRKVSNDTLEVCFSHLCASLPSDVSRQAWKFFLTKDYASLVSMKIDPRQYSHASQYADDQMIIKFLSKYKGFKHQNLKPLEKAMETFDKGELSCKVVNRKFEELELDPSKWDPTMYRILRNARRKIAKVLGTPDLNRIDDKFGWGPGANTSAKGKHTASYVKFVSRLDVTSNCLVMASCCINSRPAWVNSVIQTDSFPSFEVSLHRGAFNVVRGNEIMFVPKNASTDRSIAKEPSMNSYVQKGFGGEIRRLLLRHADVDLNDQTRNQRLAREGSLTGKLATVDVENASGSISNGVVKFFIRDDWYTLLDKARSKQGYHPIRKHWLLYEQFSSMGNGFTFELESLIFWGIAQAVSDEVDARIVSVYGDDIIVETVAYDLLVEVFGFCGFAINKDKSFADGPFRESCGTDYFMGTEVRPIYQKEILSNVESIYKLANRLRSYAHGRNHSYGCDYRFRSCWLYLYGRVAEPFRFLIPAGKGDTGFASNFDVAVPHLKRPSGGWEGFNYRCLTRTPVRERMRDRHAAYVAYLAVNDNRNGFSGETPGCWSTRLTVTARRLPLDEISDVIPFLGYFDLRNSTSPKISMSHTIDWYDLGPWC